MKDGPRADAPLSGVLLIDKPPGPTSHDVVARVRRAVRETRIGHTGTLDPLASGLLALVVGRATRLAQFMTADDKEYLATIRLGRSTPTYDAEGLDGDAPAAPEISAQAVEASLRGFTGTYLQAPPPYSAKKVGGVRAYQRARREETVELQPVEVTVAALDVLGVDDGRVRIRLACSSGFYVRRLAHDLGQRLGCGAYLEALRRTRVGEFTLEGSVSLEAIESDPARVVTGHVPIDRLLPRLARVELTEAGARKASHGSVLGPADWTRGPLDADIPAIFRVFDPDGRLLALAEARPGGLLHPCVVLV